MTERWTPVPRSFIRPRYLRSDHWLWHLWPNRDSFRSLSNDSFRRLSHDSCQPSDHGDHNQTIISPGTGIQTSTNDPDPKTSMGSGHYLDLGFGHPGRITSPSRSLIQTSNNRISDLDIPSLSTTLLGLRNSDTPGRTVTSSGLPKQESMTGPRHSWTNHNLKWCHPSHSPRFCLRSRVQCQKRDTPPIKRGMTQRTPTLSILRSLHFDR